ncbi:MAG: M23 family metallopeptidase [Bacteroidetes bacterium]|nr:M23 family metallopeptidase [Bacteroidota bacterium]
MQKTIFWTFFLFFLPFSLLAQTRYPQNDFRSPVDTALTLAGNFGEIRPNHFHAGFDIRTNNREGMPIYAVADGYISRIKISAFGYGKAIYVTHPNGYTSVYGHLKDFDNDVQTFTTKIQYLKESYEIDTALAPTTLPIKKGELIGISGNTGGSQGPHLHFEIRDTKTEMPINPYYFGYLIADTVKPRITQIAVYPMNDNSRIFGKGFGSSKKIAPVYKKGKYTYLKQDSVTVSGQIGFGIECYDTETKSTNKNGVFSIELQSGGKRIYYHELETFTFENSRYVNAHIDYESKQKQGTKIQRCFVTTNNKSGIYKDVINKGILNFTDDSVHWIKFIVKDFVGNTTELLLKVKSSSSKLSGEMTSKLPIYNCLEEIKHETEDIKIKIPAEALYENTHFYCTKNGSAPLTFSPIYEIMNENIALQKAITLSIKPVRLPDSLQSKACIVSVNKKGGKSYEGGGFTDGWVTTQTKEFGNYAIGIDTVAPKLKPAFKIIKEQIPDLSKAKKIGVIASDNLSGIRKYRATIDGKWVLCEYEFKQNLLFYTFDYKIEPGLHEFKIEVTDDKANTSILTFIFKR